jgi:hypothetical protein
MSGIGGIAYGQSQYASSGSRLTGNKAFREFIYFQEERSWLTTFSYTELISVAEGFTTHLAEIWIRLIDYITTTHVRTGISISKTITEVVSLQESFVSVVIKVLQETLALVETFFIRRRFEFTDYVEVLFSNIMSFSKTFKEITSVIQSVTERISGVFSKDNIVVTSQEVSSIISKTFQEALSLLEVMRRRLDGILMGWTKRDLPETDWEKRDNVDTTWEKQDRPDV